LLQGSKKILYCFPRGCLYSHDGDASGQVSGFVGFGPVKKYVSGRHDKVESFFPRHGFCLLFYQLPAPAEHYFAQRGQRIRHSFFKGVIVS